MKTLSREDWTFNLRGLISCDSFIGIIYLKRWAQDKLDKNAETRLTAQEISS